MSDGTIQYTHSIFSLAGVFQEEKKYNQAFRVYYQGRNVAKANKDNCSMSEFSNALGVIRYRQEQYLKAIPLLKQANEETHLCESSTFLHQFIQPQSILNTIALCFEKSGKTDSAVHHYGLALAFIKKMKDHIHINRTSSLLRWLLSKAIWVVHMLKWAILKEPKYIC